VGHDDEIRDSPTAWVAKHVRGYVESDGRRGHRWHGVKTLLLTTTGRKTGARRRTALIYGRDRDRYVVVASAGGKPNHPSWYLNLVDAPRVDVQVGPDRFRATASTSSGRTRTRLWRTMAEIWPDYERYQARTDREIPVVVLDPVG
jgi:deazaflavin-dependent oxidoreductase (nitroreductase family)